MHTIDVMRCGGAVLALSMVGCGKGPMNPHSLVPACKAGPIVAQIDQLMPPLERRRAVDLHTPTSLHRLIEPGCIAPFRAQSQQEAEEIDASITEVGKMNVWLIPRDALTSKVAPIGTGRLYIGKGGLQIDVKTASGDTALYIELKDKHAIVRMPGQPVFDADVDPMATTPLPIPVDALGAAIDGCAADQRVGIDDGGNTIEAKRGELPLWRTRWLNGEQTAAIDTGMACNASDAQFSWQTTAGDMAHVLTALSARAPLAIRIEIFEPPMKPGSQTIVGPG